MLDRAEEKLYTLQHGTRVPRDGNLENEDALSSERETRTATSNGTDIEALVEKDQIRLILAIVEAQSFGAAADRLGITRSSISQQVKRLEVLAGFQLFRRNRRGVQPTSGCEVVMSYAKAIAGIREEMKQHFQRLTTSQRICIGMGEDFCRTALPSFLGMLQAQFPAIELRVLSGGYDMLAEAVDARSIDIAVMRRWDRFPQARTLWRNEQVWYGHDRFHTAVADPIPLVVPCHPNPLRQTILDVLKRNRRTWEIRYEGVGLAGIEAAIRGGLGLCAGPRAMPMYGSDDVGDGSGLPPLPEVEFVMTGPLNPSDGVAEMVAKLLEGLAKDGFRGAGPAVAPAVADHA